jgi:hypothetical protein
VAQLVEALRYKPEGRGLDSRCCHWNFSFAIILPAALGSTQPLTEMSAVRMADNLTTFMCRLPRNLGDSWNPKGLSRPVMGLLYLF